MSHVRTSRRGLTLLELVFALSITALVALAISGMMGALASGVDTRSDNRSVMARAQAAQTRLSAYIAPSRCFLNISRSELVLWLNDGRESGTVHASEIRWILHDQGTRTLSVHYVKFPDGWTQIARQLSDKEYAASTDWSTVLSFYESMGWTAAYTILDDVELVSAAGDNVDPAKSTIVEIDLNFNPDDEPVSLHLACAVRQHFPPDK